jgi:hypothetical protein
MFPARFQVVIFTIGLLLHFPLSAQTIRQTFLTDEPFAAGETLVWTPAFQKCWDELAKNVGAEEIPLKPETPFVRHLNSFTFDYEATVPKRSHFVFIAGMGNQFIDQANALIMAQFGGTVEPLAKNYFEPFGPDFFPPEDVLHRVLLSILSHNHDFTSSFVPNAKPLPFHGGSGAPQFTKSFGSWRGSQPAVPSSVKVLHYDAANRRHAISIPGDAEDISLILLMNESLDTVGAQIDQIHTWIKQAAANATPDSLSFLQPIDTFLVPKLKLTHHMDFADLLRGTAHFPGGDLVIARAGQSVQLTLHESGAEMVTKAYLIPPTFLSSDAGGAPGRTTPPNERQFVFDRPFSLMFWKKGAEIPFFFARIDIGAVEGF